VLRDSRVREGLPHAALSAARHRQAASRPYQQRDRRACPQHRGPEGLAWAGVPAGIDPPRARLSGKEYANVTMRVPMPGLALAALFSAAVAIPASAQEQTWVAVASDGAGLWGIAVGMATRQAAEASAVGECSMYCTVKFTAQARCVAYAFSETGR